MGWARRAPLAVAATVTVVTTLASTAGPAIAAVTPAPSPSTAAQLEDQVRRSAELLAEAERAHAQADASAATALETYQRAQRRAEQASREAATAAAALQSATKRTAAAQATLARYLGSVYRSGVGNRRLSVLNDLIDAEDPQALFTGLSIASRVGGNRNDQLAALRRAQEQQARETARSRAAHEAARTAAAQAKAAKVRSDRAVADQRARLAVAAAALAATQESAEAAAAREAALARAQAIARTRASVPLAAVVGAQVPRPQAGCIGSPTTGFPNGHIPAAVLCPLWGTSGQMLRADAAAAFNALSAEYAKTFSAPICVTDSYRSYDEQVAVRAAKPTLAAVPGTSNHGWGVAVDLCDGVQSFGSPQHEWLRTNAMAYGWFLPSWAQAGGSKPEPWHWEFAG